MGDTSEYVATIKSRHSATIMSDVEGWIFDIHVHSGQFVKKGETLMEIDPRRQQATVSSYDSQRASKEATLQWAKLQLDRALALSKSGVVSKQDLHQAQATYDSALADVKSMDAQITQQQVQLKYYSVFAATDGHVGDIPVHVGDRVTNTTLLTTIDERRGLEVYLTIPSNAPTKSRWALRWKFSTMQETYCCARRSTSSRRRSIPRSGTAGQGPGGPGRGRTSFHATSPRPDCLEHASRHHRARSSGLARQRTILRLCGRAAGWEDCSPSAASAVGPDFGQ